METVNINGNKNMNISKDEVDVIIQKAFQKTIDITQSQEVHKCKIGSDYFKNLEFHVFAELIVEKHIKNKKLTYDISVNNVIKS